MGADLAELDAAVVRAVGRGGRVVVARDGRDPLARRLASQLAARLAHTRAASVMPARTADMSSRRIEAHGAPGDVVILVAPHGGDAELVARAAAAARRRAMTIVAVTDHDRRVVARAADIVVRTSPGGIDL